MEYSGDQRERGGSKRRRWWWWWREGVAPQVKPALPSLAHREGPRCQSGQEGAEGHGADPHVFLSVWRSPVTQNNATGAHTQFSARQGHERRGGSTVLKSTQKTAFKMCRLYGRMMILKKVKTQKSNTSESKRVAKNNLIPAQVRALNVSHSTGAPALWVQPPEDRGF